MGTVFDIFMQLEFGEDVIGIDKDDDGFVYYIHILVVMNNC